MKDLILSQDEIETFIPKTKPKLVILGTMAAICARTLEGKRNDDIFYYHDNRNRFWTIIQRMFEPHKTPMRLTVQAKKEFLERHQIAMANLVSGYSVEREKAQDPSDTILFEAHASGLLVPKKICNEFKEVLKSTPIAFTCLAKSPLTNLLNHYFELNGLEQKLVERILYLPSPTRVGAEKRAFQWEQILGMNLTKNAA